jgi:hypothetical protein
MMYKQIYCHRQKQYPAPPLGGLVSLDVFTRGACSCAERSETAFGGAGNFGVFYTLFIC